MRSLPSRLPRDHARRFAVAASCDSLHTIAATVGALNYAIDDAIKAGDAPDHDPAVLLLARRIAALADRETAADELRAQCEAAVHRLSSQCQLKAVVATGQTTEAMLQEIFVRDATRFLRRFAVEAGIDERARHFSRDIGYGYAAAQLDTGTWRMTLAFASYTAGGEVEMCRAKARDDCGGPRTRFPIAVIRNPSALVDQMLRILGLPPRSTLQRAA